MVIHSGILAWRIPGLRSLAGYSPWGCKESHTTEGTKHRNTGMTGAGPEAGS